MADSWPLVVSGWVNKEVLEELTKIIGMYISQDIIFEQVRVLEDYEDIGLKAHISYIFRLGTTVIQVRLGRAQIDQELKLIKLPDRSKVTIRTYLEMMISKGLARCYRPPCH